MGKKTGFIEFQRSLPILDEPARRVENWDEFHTPLPVADLRTQGARCMNCGVPFCHVGQTDDGLTKGCPLHNLIPEWNDLVYRDQWLEAYKRLALTNNFPEFTGRVCPAPCESSCVLGINEEPVMIKEIEVAIIERAFEEGWLAPAPPKNRTGKRVAVIGSGPAGLACADELNKFGHQVTVYERADRIGGLLMYGIPNMKLDKSLVERRVSLLTAEGIEFRAGVNVGVDLTADDLRRDFDAVVLTVGATAPRDFQMTGRNLKGVHQAMDFLSANTKSLLDSGFADRNFIDVRDSRVVVIGGGDTGTDCIASALRHGCRSVTQLEIMPSPPEKILTHDRWLGSIRSFQTDYGQAEAHALFGDDPRRYTTLTKGFIGDDAGNLTALETVEIEWIERGDGKIMREINGTEKRLEADVAFLAMGFTGAAKQNFLTDLGVEITDRQTISIRPNKQTSVPHIFAAGDCERGQ